MHTPIQYCYFTHASPHQADQARSKYCHDRSRIESSCRHAKRSEVFKRHDHSPLPGLCAPFEKVFCGYNFRRVVRVVRLPSRDFSKFRDR